MLYRGRAVARSRRGRARSGREDTRAHRPRRPDCADFRVQAGQARLVRRAAPVRASARSADFAAGASMNLTARMLRRKSVEQLQREALTRGELRRVLGLWHLTA